MKLVKVIHLPWSTQEPGAFNIIGSPIGACWYRLSPSSLNHYKAVVSLADLFTKCVFLVIKVTFSVTAMCKATDCFFEARQLPYVVDLFPHTLQDMIMNDDIGSEHRLL